MKLIVAVTKNTYAIGKDNKLLVTCKEDMHYFRRYTMDHPIVMGRKTWDSIGRKFLKGRGTHYILTSQEDLGDLDLDVKYIKSLSEAPDDSVIIGGKEVYIQSFKDPRLTEISITMLHENINEPFEADTHLPEIIDAVANRWDYDNPNRWERADLINLLPFNEADVHVFKRK